jgi:LPS-assembly protein
LAESAATAEWNISADKITRFQDPERIIAEGNIILEKSEKVPPPAPRGKSVSDWNVLLEEETEAPEITPEDLPKDQTPQYRTTVVIKADWVSYDIDKQFIEAKGNVSITSGDDKLTAEDARIDLTKETGLFEQAVITREDHALHLEGKKIEKTGLNTYRIEDGWVITCKLEEGRTPPWKFSSAETDVKQGGYAVLKHARFHVNDIPILYLPYMVVPVKDTRQTGLLFPEISNSSRDGFGFSIPFFVNLSESTDFTLYPEYYSERGFMPGAEFRYVLDDRNKGKFMGSYLDDDLSDPDETAYYADTNFTHTNSERYWLRGKVDHEFENNWISRLDFDVVSDRDYLEEFRSGITGFNASQKSFLETFGRGFENHTEDKRKNTLKFLRSWTGSSLVVDFLAINDVRTIESSPTPLWELPSAEYSGAVPLPGNFTFDWDTDYVNFWRDDGIGGHRVDLFPRLSTPVPVGQYLESRAEIGGRGTFYSVEEYGDATWEDDETPNRTLLTFHTDLATTLVRDFTVDIDELSYLSHSIRPFIEYDFITDEDQDDLPLFDAVDRIEDANAVTYGVDSFFDLYDSSSNFSRQYGYVRLEQSYDLRSEGSDEPFSPIVMKLGWRPLREMTLFYKAEFPIEDDQNTTHGLEGYFTNSRGDSFALDYRYNEDQNIEQINGSFRAMILPWIRAELLVEHSISESETNDAVFALTYLAQCWSVQLKTKYTPTDERVMLVFNLANIGSPLGLSF